MSDITIEQALLHRVGGEGRILARSSGFLGDWEDEIRRLAAGFGERPRGVACPGAVFAKPLGRQHVAVVQVADQGSDDGGRPVALGFHFLIVPAEAYTSLWGDPFVLADRAPAPWHARGTLPALNWSAEPLPPRTVEQVRQVLQRTRAAALVEGQEVSDNWEQPPERQAEESLSPALLGGAQVLVDGGRLVLERSAPDTELLRGLWTLLPTSTRCRLWPASFAFGNELDFDAVIVPPGTCEEPAYPGYTTEDQACDYPQGYYELNLQIAAESGSQADLDALFGRRSWAETWRLGLTLLVVLGLLALALNFLHSPNKAQVDPQAKLKQRYRAAGAAALTAAGNPWTAFGLWTAGQKNVWKKPAKVVP